MSEQERGLIPAEAAAYERHGAPRGAQFTRPLLALARPWPGARVLDAGCGAGVPVADRLMRAGADVTGLDVSIGQLHLFRRHVDRAHAVCGDIEALPFPSARFDAVVSYYAIIHIPRSDHSRVFGEIARVLHVGGVALLCLGASDNPADHDPSSWLGAPMFWSHFDAATNLELLAAARFDVMWEREIADPMSHGSHQFVLARRC
jgi:ubiquinone/menaquinone biosynthesis C-methylase UbiE